LTERTHKPVRLFFSYSHRDERYLDRLKTHLVGLSRQGLIEEWHDRKIAPGQEWDKAIDENLQASEIVLLLVTPDFMRSEYVSEKEIKKAIEKHERGEARVIPIIVRPADWHWAPFGQLQALPKDAKPITEWSNRDRAWLDVIRGIRKAVEELTGESSERGAREEHQEVPRPAVEDREPEESPSREREREIEGPTDRAEPSSLHQYREEVQAAWVDGELHGREAERLRDLANELGLNANAAADIEREVMGDTIETILERQEEAARREQRNRQLDELYTQARRLHGDRKWQAVIDVFEQIHNEDPAYSDPEGLLRSARQSLEASEPQRHQTAGRSTAQAEQVQPDYSTDTRSQLPFSILGRNWWALALAGLIDASHGLGDYVVLSSGLSASYRLLAGSMMIAIGVFMLIVSTTAHPGLMLRTQGVISGLAGLVALLSGAIEPPYPPSDASSFLDASQSMPFFVVHVFAFALWGVCIGVIQIVVATRLGWDLGVIRLMFVSGTLLVLYGIYVFYALFQWAGAIPWLSGSLLLASGISLVAFAFRVRQREDRELGA
jgi:uncharacterized membrane protein HdeD (DUF308 family)